MKYLASTARLFALFVTASAQADNLVVNGNFEAGDFYGWHVDDPTLGTFVAGAFAGQVPHGGDYFVALGADGLGTISQNLHTVAGRTYVLSYFLASDGMSPNEFKVTWGATTLTDQLNIPAQGYRAYKFQVSATSASTNLTFYVRNHLGFLSLDDVSVTTASP